MFFCQWLIYISQEVITMFDIKQWKWGIKETALMWRLHHGFSIVLWEWGDCLNLRLSSFGSIKLGLGVGDLVLEQDLDQVLGEWGAGGFTDEVPAGVSWHFSGVGGIRLTTGGGMAFSSWTAAVVLIISTAAVCPSDIVLDSMIPSCDINMSIREFFGQCLMNFNTNGQWNGGCAVHFTKPDCGNMNCNE